MSTRSEASLAVGGLAASPAALAVSGTATAAPAALAMKALRSNPEGFLEGGLSVIGGLRRLRKSGARLRRFLGQQDRPADVPTEALAVNGRPLSTKSVIRSRLDCDQTWNVLSPAA